MKKWISLLLCLSFLLILPLSVSAADAYVTDKAGLLTAQQSAELEETCRSFRDTSGMEIAILTLDGLYGVPAQMYADDYFDSHYGADGILLLVAMAEREWYISTCGTAIETFPDSDLAAMENSLLSGLSEGNYYEAFRSFLSDADFYSSADDVSDFSACLLLALPGGAVLAVIVLFILRSGMNTKRSQRTACQYIVKDSYQMLRHQDLFLYSKLHKQEKPQNNSGSGTHTSSSGRSHGGRGGKF